MKHALSKADREFRESFESNRIPPPDFDHRAHIRLAYAYLAESTPDEATARMREALLGFLRHHGIEITKYHETLTRAWILAVRHFMERSSPAESADDFIEKNPLLLDSRIMMTHYSAEVLFSPDAREQYVEPDLDPIPEHDP